MASRPKRPKRPTRRRAAKIAFDAILIEGALLQPELASRVATADPTPQLAVEYGLDPGEKLREVVQTKFAIAQSFHTRFNGSDQGPAALKRFLTSLFVQVFEFEDLSETVPITFDDRIFPIGHQALGGRVPIVFAPFEEIDKGNRAFGDNNRQRAPAQLLQEYLNAEEAALWGLVCDGRTLRLYRDNATLTRPAYIEADLAMLFDAEAPRLADFSALWLLIHASRFGKPGTAPTDCALERWREEGRENGARAREDLRKGVEDALSLLGQGFLAHPANAKLREDLSRGTLTPQAYLDGLLRLVYRLIFVFAAEDRDLLHLPQPEEPEAFESWRTARNIYRRGYGLGRLRELSAKRHTHDRNFDGWEGVKILFRELWHGQPKLALPALGGLFAPTAQVRDFADCQIANQFFYAAIFKLAWLNTGSALERVNWRDMETEELGSVYESLLELTPSLTGPLGFEFVQAAGDKRKTTASYYTPDSLVQALLNETLDPLIAERTKGKSGQDAINALLDLRIIDPACGSGHFLLAAARRLAVRCAQFDKPGEAPSPVDYRHWLREVARRSLFGVDKNPMAIELAKVALWIETVEPGKPLSFLDAHLRCGDSLLGVYDLGALNRGIPDEAYKPLTGDVKAATSEWRKRNKAERDARKQGELAYFEPPREMLEAVRTLEAQAEDELVAVETKAAKFSALMTGPDRHRMEAACDLYVAAFLMPKTEGPVRMTGDGGAFIPTSRDVWDKLAGTPPRGLFEAQAVKMARDAHAFHWPLEFPQVFFPGAGRVPGFDLALGNPPWERIKLQEQEFFAARDRDIATAPNKAERQKLIDALAEAEAGTTKRWLHEEFMSAKRIAEAASVFARTAGDAGGRFPLTGTGDVNTYALFAELFATAARYVGIIIPTGIATDATTASFFSNLVSKQRLFALMSFREIRRSFTATDDRNPFCLLALTERASSTTFAFSLDTVQEISDKERRFNLTPAEIAAINPNTRTAPVFRSKADAELTKQIYARVPVLIDDSKDKDGNPWGISFARLFDMSNDSGLFRTAPQLAGAGFVRDGRDWVSPNPGDRYVPLYEAKMIHHYNHRWATYEGGAAEDKARDTTDAERADPTFEAEPRYWVPEAEVASRLAAKGWTRGWLMGWRDICRATDERTVIAGAIPRSGVGHTSPLFFLEVEPPKWAAFLAVMSSITLDYVARQKVGGTHLTYGYLNQFPWPIPSSFTETNLAFIVPRVLELTYTSHSMKPFAEDLGYTGNTPFPWNEDRRAPLRAELDAKIAKLYGLTRDQLRYILDPADIYGPTYPSETFRVLKDKETKKYNGDYRTARLVLDAWDRMDRGELK